MKDLIYRLRSRPLHVRRRVTLAASGAITGVVAMVWLVAGITLGSFSFSTPEQNNAVASIGSAFSQANQQAAVYAGVTPMGTVATTTNAGATSGGLTIIQTKQTSSIVQVDTSKQTTIPF